eukprot:TRINITY_DN2247_c0_g1_i2.p4 TRINITY_DN2247_c0_g1~~TRINITY_DN2247_c0_g1_i2.p4  ORF type:complete len:122 (-),score=24.95 TRINITY_DN2247_c0_g1_i2:88-453(-)
MFYGVKAKDEAAIKNKKFDFVTSVQDFCLQIKNDYAMFNNGKLDENLQIRVFQVRKEDIAQEILLKKNIKLDQHIQPELKRHLSIASSDIQDNLVKQIHLNENQKIQDNIQDESYLNDLLN